MVDIITAKLNDTGAVKEWVLADGAQINVSIHRSLTSSLFDQLLRLELYFLGLLRKVFQHLLLAALYGLVEYHLVDFVCDATPAIL